jgi:hypothetical protein
MSRILMFLSYVWYPCITGRQPAHAVKYKIMALLLYVPWACRLCDMQMNQVSPYCKLYMSFISLVCLMERTVVTYYINVLICSTRIRAICIQIVKLSYFYIHIKLFTLPFNQIDMKYTSFRPNNLKKSVCPCVAHVYVHCCCT